MYLLYSMEKEYFVHSSSVVDEGAQIGAGTKIWHFCHVMPTAVIGENCNIGQNVFIDNKTRIGNRVKIQNNVSVYNRVEIGDECFLGPSMVFTNVVNPRAGVERKDEYRITVLEKGVTIGANATIVCGVRLGEYSFVGAGALVNKDLPAYALVVGNPCRQIGWMSAYGEKLQFGPDGIAVCSGTGQRYKLVSEACIELMED